MRRLFIVRHAKSSWKDSSLDDFDRPLNKRGEQNAPFMAKILKQREIKPDFILSSSALRAKKTAKIFAKILKCENINFDEDLYESPHLTLENIIKSMDDKYETVLLFGHNPSLNLLVDNLVGVYDNIPTCGIVEIEFTTDEWLNISSDNAKLISFDYPKNHK